MGFFKTLTNAPKFQNQQVGDFERIERMPAPPQPMQPRPSLVVGGPAYFTPEGYQAPVQPEQAFMPTDRRPDPIGDNFRKPYERPIMPMPMPPLPIAQQPVQRLPQPDYSGISSPDPKYETFEDYMNRPEEEMRFERMPAGMGSGLLGSKRYEGEEQVMMPIGPEYLDERPRSKGGLAGLIQDLARKVRNRVEPMPEPEIIPSRDMPFAPSIDMPFSRLLNIPLPSLPTIAEASMPIIEENSPTTMLMEEDLYPGASKNLRNLRLDM
jgi:hypothetical protein